MRKNKSVKEVSQSRSRPSQGKQISIELEPLSAKQKQNSKAVSRQQSKQLTDRSLNWQHPSVSENILKDILNYRNISHSDLKSNKNSSTVTVYERHQDIMSQFAKINKKTFSGDNVRKNQKLVLDHSMPTSYPSKTMDMPYQQKSIAMIQSQFLGSDIQDPMQYRGLFSIQSMNGQPQKELEAQIHQLAANLDQLNIIEEAITREYSDLIPEWLKMIEIQAKMHQVQQKLQQYENNINAFHVQLVISNEKLLNASRQLVNYRKSWDQRGNGARTKVLDQAIYAHEQFVKKITIRDFEQTLLFNMKVAIPDHQGKNSLKGIYFQLFHSKSTKKFTMILKKHTAHMDLYDAKILNDFVKRINDLDAQYSRCQTQATPHQDEQLLQSLQEAAIFVEQIKFHLVNSQNSRNQVKNGLNELQFQWKNCQQRVLKRIEQVNLQVRGQYEKETERAADFKTLLINKYTSKYKELKEIREGKKKVAEEVGRVQEQLASLK